MVYQDKKKEIEEQTAFADYLASFWNPEAVKKVQEVRKSASQHRFKGDTEFEENVVSGEYKDNPLIDAILKLREIEGRNEKRRRATENKRAPKSKLPTDLSSIRKTLDRFNKE